jgi:hypothetical protein
MKQFQQQLDMHKPFQSEVDASGNILFDYTPENGQITFETEFGKHLASIGADLNYTTYFEVGTWKGNGTTRCVIEGIVQRYQRNSMRNVHFWSLESNLVFYREALYFWQQIPMPCLHLLYGRLHEDCLMTKEEIINHPYYPLVKSHYEDWYEQDSMDYNISPCVDMDLLPDLDVIILDGGEFSGYADWLVLKKKNPRVVCLDDIHVMKNEKVFKELLSDPLWDLFVKGDERHGFAIFKKKESLV